MAIAEDYSFRLHITDSLKSHEQPNNAFSDAFVFRHINHETEGWADIVIAQVKSVHVINSEAAYRAAINDAKYETYFTQETSWRCTHQDYRPPEVPEIDFGCHGDTTTLGRYVLYKYPQGEVNMPAHLMRSHDREYGKYGNSSWVLERGRNNIPIKVGETTLLQAQSGTLYFDTASTTITADSWIMGVDKSTDNRN